MQYLLMLHFRAGEGPQEGTPEFDVEMARWGELNTELREAGAVVAASGLHVDATTTVRAPGGPRRGRRPTGRRSPGSTPNSRARTRRRSWPSTAPSAVRFAEGPTAGLAILDGLAADARLDRYQPLHAARAELLRRIGDAAGADAAYRGGDRAVGQRRRARGARAPAARGGRLTN